MWRRLLLVLLLSSAATAQDVSPGAGDAASFDSWLAAYRSAAAARGVSVATLDAVLGGLSFSPRVVELDRGQPDDSARGAAPARFDDYLAQRLDAGRIAGGRDTAQRLSVVLGRVEAESGVPATIILGIWGMESSYGRVTGDFDVPRSLATLAWDGRRRALFTKELDAAVTIVDRGLAPRAALKGSWAGAMGEPQFLPSSYLDYARDGDGDGQADIWTNDADVAASIGNYLARHGWQRGLRWGQAVTVPATLDRQRIRDLVRPASCVRPLEKHSRWISIAEWKRLGLTSATPFPADTIIATLVEPDGPGQGAYLTTGNYRALLGYNCSNFYALSVALLADSIADPETALRATQ